MKLTIFGKTYSVVPEMTMIASKISTLIRDDDTYTFYIAQNQYNPSEDDTILLVNIRNKIVYPILLYVFDEIVEPYHESVMSSFPFASIIKGKAMDYVICPRQEIEKHHGRLTSRYGMYINSSTMYLCPDLKTDFDRFSTQYSYKGKEVSKNSIIATTHMSRSHSQLSENTALKSADPNRINLNHQQTSVSPPTSQFMTHPPIKSNALPLKQAGSNETGKVNIKSFCGITDDSLSLLLSKNDLLCVINKKTGVVSYFDLQSIYNNDLLGVKNEIDIIRLIGKCPTIAYDVQTIKIADLRHVIKQYDKKKENSATKQMFSMANGCLYITFSPLDIIAKEINIKNLAIELHKNANGNYEKLRSSIKAYNLDTYLVCTSNGFFVVVVDSSKKCKIISSTTIYNSFSNAKSIGDIMAMFPDKMIIDGTSIKIESESDVSSISKVPEKAFDICKNKTIVRDRFYGYDQPSKTIIYGDIPK